MKREQQSFVQQNCKRMKWNYGEGEQQPPPNMTAKGIGRGTNISTIRQQSGNIGPRCENNIVPVGQKSSKPGGMMNNADKEEVTAVQRANNIINGFVKNTEDMSAKISQKRMEIETKMQRIEEITARRENQRAEQGFSEEEFQYKTAALLQAKESFEEARKKGPEIIAHAKMILEKEAVAHRINKLSLSFYITQLQTVINSCITKINEVDQIANEHREFADRVEFTLENESRDDIKAALEKLNEAEAEMRRSAKEVQTVGIQVDEPVPSPAVSPHVEEANVPAIDPDEEVDKESDFLGIF